MFHEKSDDNAPWSMTRVVAFMFAWGVLYALTLYATKATPINWPFAAVAGATILAVPLQSIFTWFREYLSTKSGRELADTLLHKAQDAVGLGMLTTATIPIPASQPTVKTTTTVTPGDKG
jgi:hypothetical protein